MAAGIFAALNFSSVLQSVTLVGSRFQSLVVLGKKEFFIHRWLHEVGRVCMPGSVCPYGMLVTRTYYATITNVYSVML